MKPLTITPPALTAGGNTLRRLLWPLTRAAKGLLWAIAALTLAACPPEAAGRSSAGPGNAENHGASSPACDKLDAAVAALKKNPADKDLYLCALELLPDSLSSPADNKSGPDAEAFRTITIRALKKEKDFYGYYLGLCKLQRAGGETKEALLNCKKALELDATPYAVYRELGLTWARNGNTAKADEMLSQGVELFANTYRAYFDRAALRENSGETKTALADYLKALSLLKEPGTVRQLRDAAVMSARIKELSTREKSQPLTQTPAQPSQPAKKTKDTAAGGGASAISPSTDTLAGAPSAADIESCARDFRLELTAASYDAAERSSARCLKLSPLDPELRKDRAALLVRLGRYEEAIGQYARAGELYKNRPMRAFCQVKTAEILLKLGLGADAEKTYKAALETSSGDLNALKGLAKIYEERGDLRSAAAVYAKILSTEPANAEARLRLSEIETELTPPEQALADLKQRKAVDSQKPAAGPEDIKLFKDITAADRDGAVDYIKRRHPSLRGLVLERPGVIGPRLVLTGEGYRHYLSFLSQEAIVFFEGKSITLREIFALRDNSGAPLFDKAGKLTAEGAAALRLARKGQKSWLLTYEPVPLSPLAEKANMEIQTARGQGYEEISEPEYLWLSRATNCPEDIILAPPMNAKRINDGARIRYMICFRGFAPCLNSVNKSLPNYIEAYRSGKTEISDSRTSTAFFGSGAVKKLRLCENGKIWSGEGTGI